MEFLTNSSFRLNEIDAEVPDVSATMIRRVSSSLIVSCEDLRRRIITRSHLHVGNAQMQSP